MVPTDGLITYYQNNVKPHYCSYTSLASLTGQVTFINIVKLNHISYTEKFQLETEDHLISIMSSSGIQSDQWNLYKKKSRKPQRMYFGQRREYKRLVFTSMMRTFWRSCRKRSVFLLSGKTARTQLPETASSTCKGGPRPCYTTVE